MKYLRFSLIILALLSVIIGAGSAPQASAAAPLKEVSYYPKDYAWDRFWQNCAKVKTVMESDLNLIQSLGANTVRIFLSPTVMGYPTPSAASQQCFDDYLALIAAHNLKAHVNLFDCWQSWTDISGSKQWVDAIVLPRKDDPRIALWELRNEAGLDKPEIQAWVQALFPYLKQKAGSTPATVSVSKVEWLQTLKDLTAAAPPDIYSLHWYPNPMTWTDIFPQSLAGALAVVPKDQLLIGEFGLSTFAFSDASQVDLFNDIFYYAHQNGITNFGVWTLNDFPDGTGQCGGAVPAVADEWYFGLYPVDGPVKPGASVVSDAYHGKYPIALRSFRLRNGTFESMNPYSNRIDNWWPWDQNWSGEEWGTQDCSVHRGGNCSAVLIGNGALAVGMYSSPALPVAPGKPYAVEGYLRTKDLNGWARLTLSWFDGTGKWMDRDTKVEVTDANLADWKFLGTGDTPAPAGAAYVQVYVQMYSTNAAAHVWFDDVRMVTERLYLPAVRTP